MTTFKAGNVEEWLEEYVIYLRKSRSDNPKESVEETLQKHEQELQEWAIEHIGKRIEEKNIYREVVSGGEDVEERPEFIKVLQRMEKGNIKGVLVVDTARISRTGIYGAGDIINAFLYTDTLICTPFKTYDLKNDIDKKFLELEMIKHSEFLQYTKEVLGRGRMRAIKNGCYLGGDTPFGYDKEKLKNDKGYKLVIVEKEAEIVKMIYDLYLEGLGTVNIANYLNKEGYLTRSGEAFTPNYARSILTNPTYYGLITWQKRKTVKVFQNGKVVKKNVTNEKPILIKGLHDPIITEEQFFAVQEHMKAHASSKVPRTSEIKNPLASLCECGKCGRAMVRKIPTGKNRTTIRKHDFDKQELIDFLQEYKKKSGLSLPKIATLLEVSRGKVDSWLCSNPDRVYFSKCFADKWFDIKKVLKIDTDKWDKIVTEYEDNVDNATFVCSGLNCDNSSVALRLVEAKVLEILEAHLADYRYFLDNYEEEIKVKIADTADKLKKLEEREAKFNKRLKNAKMFYELEDYTREEFLEVKEEVQKALLLIKLEKEKLEEDSGQDLIVKYKKSIPILSEVIKQYPVLNTQEKNELLKDIIERIIYTRDKGTEFKLEVFLRV